MGLNDAYAKAVESMRRIDPRTAASASGVEYREDRFIITLFNRTYAVQFPGGGVVEVGADSRENKLIEVLLMHYLTHADGAAVSGVWINYRQLPGAKLFEQRFINLVSRPMLEFCGDSIDNFKGAACALGGRPMDSTGDAAFRFEALPRLPMACIFHCGEDAISPSLNILFDESAPHYLPTEDLTILGGIMNSLMKKGRQNGL